MDQLTVGEGTACPEPNFALLRVSLWVSKALSGLIFTVSLTRFGISEEADLWGKSSTTPRLRLQTERRQGQSGGGVGVARLVPACLACTGAPAGSQHLTELHTSAPERGRRQEAQVLFRLFLATLP